MKKVFLVLSFVSFVFFSCEKEQISSQGQASGKGSKYMSPAVESGVVADLPPEDPEGQGGAGGDLTFYPPQSPAIFNAAPFVPSGQPTSSFSSTGGLTTDMVAFGPAETDAFPFVPPTGSAKVWMGFIFRTGGYTLVVQGYPLAVSNGHSYWYGGELLTKLVGGSVESGSFVWVPGNPVHADPGHFEWRDGGSYNTTNVLVTITELSINAQDRLTLKATVKMGGSTYQINKTNFIRIH